MYDTTPPRSVKNRFVFFLIVCPNEHSQRNFFPQDYFLSLSFILHNLSKSISSQSHNKVYVVFIISLTTLTPSTSNKRHNSGSSFTPTSASEILSLILLASSKSSLAAAVLLRSLHRPMRIPAAANAEPADLRRRAYSKRSSGNTKQVFAGY